MEAQEGGLGEGGRIYSQRCPPPKVAFWVSTSILSMIMYRMSEGNPPRGRSKWPPLTHAGIGRSSTHCAPNLSTRPLERSISRNRGVTIRAGHESSRPPPRRPRVRAPGAFELFSLRKAPLWRWSCRAKAAPWRRRSRWCPSAPGRGRAGTRSPISAPRGSTSSADGDVQRRWSMPAGNATISKV